MQYTISKPIYRHLWSGYITTILKDNIPVASMRGNDQPESMLNAIKLAMLIAINESEKMMNGKIE